MKMINDNVFFLPLIMCKYELCKKEFNPSRKDKVFCCRECKMKNRLRKVYYLRKGREII